VAFADDEGEVTMREAFELWLYADILHDDFDKEVRWERIGPARPIVRSTAHYYMNMLLSVAHFFRSVIELDPALASVPTPTRASGTDRASG
jgi:hypothetical protein